MQRQILSLIQNDLPQKMVLLSGPRQCGKTTLSKQLASDFVYLNYDNAQDRHFLAKGEWDRTKPLWIFDEFHKMRKWKSWLKGVFDTKAAQISMMVTGSARMDTYKRGGDSLAGRYFSYRLHPFTVAELKEQMPAEDALQRILQVGGFPEPFLRNQETFARRWRRSHLDTILREDLFDLEKVRDIRSIEILVDLLRTRVGSGVSFSSLATDLQVSVPTIKHWLQILEDLYIIFAVRPYHRNITRSLLKEPKYYFYDTGAVAEVSENPGPVLENAVACGLLQGLQFLEDQTGRRTNLCYLRDKEKREVDFLATIDENPVQMIEVKWSDDAFSPALLHFQKYLPAVPAFQVVYKLDRPRSTATGIQMTSAASFLKSIDFARYQPNSFLP